MSSRSNSHGAPLKTPKPGQTTRKRPKVGDRDPTYKKPAKKKPSTAPTKRKPVKVSDNPLVHRRDSKNRPVGGGGHSRDLSMMEKVNEMQTGKKRK